MPRRSAAPEAPAQPGRWPTAPDAPVATRKRSRRRLQIVPQPAPPAEEPSPDETLPPDAPPDSLPQHPPEPLANPLPPEKRPLPPAAINFAARKAKAEPKVQTLLERFTQHRLNLEYPQVLDDARRLLLMALQIEEHVCPECGHHEPRMGQDEAEARFTEIQAQLLDREFQQAMTRRDLGSLGGKPASVPVSVNVGPDGSATPLVRPSAQLAERLGPASPIQRAVRRQADSQLVLSRRQRRQMEQARRHA